MGNSRHTLSAEMRKHKPSVVVGEFLAWLDDRNTEWEKHDGIFRQEDGPKVEDFLHAIEFEADAKKRAVIATECHRSRKKRRAAKDVVALLRPVREFMTDTSNKYYLKRMRKLYSDLKHQEEYLEGERTYKPRAQRESGESSQSEEECTDA